MPTYEYKCPAGHEFEHFVSRISDGTSTMACPSCGDVAHRRISAGGAILFKGSGFYITDYGKDGKKDLRTRAAAASSAKGETPREGASGDTAAAKPSDGGSADAKPADAKAAGPKAADAKGAAPAAPPSKGSSAG